MASNPNASRNAYSQWYQQHKTLVWGSAAAAAALYAAYKSYNSSDDEGASSGPQRQRRQAPSHFQQIRSMVTNYSSAAASLSQTAAIVSADLRTFLSSDAEEIPQSLRQLNRLLQAPELQETVTTVTTSVVRGVSAATGMGGPGSGPTGPALVDTVIEAVLSERGRGLVGMAVGVATRNVTSSLCEFLERRMDGASTSGQGQGPGGMGVKEVLDLLTSEQGERLLSLLLTKSIRTAVSSYVDATTGYNPYDDMLSSIAKQDNRDALTDLLSRISASFCRELVTSVRRAAAANPHGRRGAAAGDASAAASSAAAAATATAASSSSGGSTPRSSTSSRTGSASSVSALSAGGGGGAACAQQRPQTPQPSGAVAGAAAVLDGLTAKEACFGGAGGSGSAVTTVAAPLVLKPNQRAHGSGGGGLQARVVLGGGGANAAAGGGLGRVLLSQSAPPPWLGQIVELLRERDVRSLAVDVVSSATREGARGAMEGLFQGGDGGGLRALVSSVVAVPTSGAAATRLYVLATLAVSLAMYALSPRVLLL